MDRDIALVWAVIERAAMDWRALCRGQKPTSDCNFSELERFFDVDCPDCYQIGVGEIYRRLKVERGQTDAEKHQEIDRRAAETGRR